MKDAAVLRASLALSTRDVLSSLLLDIAQREALPTPSRSAGGRSGFSRLGRTAI